MKDQKHPIEFPDYHLGKAVKTILKQKSMLQSTLAKGIGVHPAAIPRFFNNRDLPRERVLAFSKFLNVDLFTHYLSRENQEFLKKGKHAYLLEEENARLKQALEQQRMESREACEALETQVDQLKQEVEGLNASLQKENEIRRKAETRIQVLEGQLKIIKELGLSDR